MKKGYSVAIHYESLADIEDDTNLDAIKNILKQPGLNSLHLYIGTNESDGGEKPHLHE